MALGNDEFFDRYDSEISELVSKFAGYYTQVDRQSIRVWLRQFEGQHKQAGLKLLQRLDYYSQSRVVDELKELQRQFLSVLNGDLAEIYFSAYGGAGKSGQELLSRYRLANRLTSQKWQGHFLYLSELQTLINKEPLVIALVDDFIGSGDTVINSWENVRALIPQNAKPFLLALVGFHGAIGRIRDQTGLEVVVNKELQDADKVFSPQNDEFSEEEKRVLLQYCVAADSEPEGYGNTQAKIVFYYRSPNNTISILRCTNPQWKGLFPRSP